jgi:methyl-accepting chemotaxis protein
MTKKGGIKMFKNMTLSGKLWGLTLGLLVAVGLVAGSSILSISGILSTNQEFSYAAELDTFLTEKEVDHLNWINKVKDLFVKNPETLEVAMDPTKCGLGKFLYGEEARKLAQYRPELVSYLDAIKAPHKHLHESAVHINEVWQQIHPGLSLTLAGRLDEHRRWAGSISESLMENKEITVQLDPTRCAFGKWLTGDESRKLTAEWPEFGAVIAEVTDHHKKLHESAAMIKAATTEEAKKEIYLGETVRQLTAVGKLFQQAQDLEAGLEKARAEAHHIFDMKTLPALMDTKDKMAALTTQFDRMRTIAEETMVSKGANSKLASIVVTAAAFIIGVLLSFFLIRSITRPVFRIIEGLNEGSDQVASASGQVSSASQSLAEGSSEQAASIEETSSSLEEMSSMTKQNADNANQADKLMKEANQVVTKADASMTELTHSMEEISKASEETSKIIKTIDEIAFQTNLLALNAAVEAARAGEAGAGFAVVADEVRNLAMRAADAARNTADLIEGTVKKVKDGGDLVATTNEAFAEVAGSAAKVGDLVGEIAAASKEQAEGIEQVNKAVIEMDKVVQQNAANAEESASASEEMNAQAEQMKSMVGQLVNVVGGAGDGEKGALTAKTQAAKTATDSTRFSHSVPARKTESGDSVVHAVREVKPEQVIPMDDEDFQDF